MVSKKEKRGKEMGFDRIGGQRAGKKTGWKILLQETGAKMDPDKD